MKTLNNTEKEMLNFLKSRYDYIEKFDAVKFLKSNRCCTIRQSINVWNKFDEDTNY